VVLEPVAVFELEAVREDGVVEEVAANVGRIDDGCNAVLGEVGGGADAGEHEDLGALVDARGHNDFSAGAKGVLFVVGADDDDADGRGALEDEAFGVGVRDDGHVGLVLEEYGGGRARAVVDGADALEKSALVARVDVGRELLALADPGFLQCVAERLELGNQVGVGDMQRAVAADVLQIGREELLIVVICGRLLDMSESRQDSMLLN
jgi:hypothetical protein